MGGQVMFPQTDKEKKIGNELSFLFEKRWTSSHVYRVLDIVLTFSFTLPVEISDLVKMELQSLTHIQCVCFHVASIPNEMDQAE